MRQMKDSGIEWIGEIPEGWEVRKIKNIASEKNSLFMDGDWIESDIIEDTGIRYLTTGNIGSLSFKEQGSGYISENTFKKLNCLPVYPGDLAISRLNEPLGRACFIPNNESKYVVAVDIVILRPDKSICTNYIRYYMNIEAYNSYVKLYSRGTTMPRISRTILGNMPIPLPSLAEQQRIADYLDAKCAHIDQCLELTRQSMEKLRAYKLSCITEAVTKGLDPDVPLKDSGVVWIGKIPTEWQCLPLKWITSSIKTGSTPKGAEEKYYAEEGLKWFTPSDFTHFPYIEDAVKKLSEIGAQEVKVFPKNSILLIGIGATMGKVSLSRTKCSSNQQINAIQCNANISPLFITFYLSTITDYLFKCGKFTTMPILNQEETKKIPLPLPPLPEQQRIAAYLDKKCARIDALLEEKQALLDKLAEYKKSLIFECVTGKREVPSCWNR